MTDALRTAGRVLAVVVVSTLALEGLVRLTRIAPPVNAEFAQFARDGDLPFRRRPNSHVRGRSVTGEFDYDYRHNREGFRDLDHDPVKPPDVFRIVMLGDSFTYGAGAPFDDTYPRRLESLLNARADAAGPPVRRVEVINLGLPRYFPALERIALERLGLRYQPDLIVVGLLPNDVLDTYLGLDSVTVDDSGFLVTRGGEQLGGVARWLALHSDVMRIVLRLSALLPGDRSPHLDDLYRDGGFHEKDWRAIEFELEQMGRLAREHHARFAVVNIPQTGYAKSARAYPDVRLRRWSAGRDVMFVSARDALLKAGDEGALYWQRDGHCTSAGYRVIAAALQDALVRASWAP